MSLAKFLKDFSCRYFDIDDIGCDATVHQSIKDAVQAAQDRLNEVVALKPNEVVQRCNEYNKILLESNEDCLSAEDIEKHNEAISRQLEELHKLQDKVIRLDDVWDFLDDAGCELRSKIELLPSEALEIWQPKEWHAKQIESANESLQAQIRRFQNEQRRVAEQNEILGQLRKLLSV